MSTISGAVTGLVFCFVNNNNNIHTTFRSRCQTTRTKCLYLLSIALTTFIYLFIFGQKRKQKIKKIKTTSTEKSLGWSPNKTKNATKIYKTTRQTSHPQNCRRNKRLKKDHFCYFLFKSLIVSYPPPSLLSITIKPHCPFHTSLTVLIWYFS